MYETVNANVLGLTARIVAAYMQYNQVATDTLSDLIRSVYRSLATAGQPAPGQLKSPTPAVPVKRSVFPDYIVCLEDGKKLKMLKRHLQTSYGMSPADYRTKWGLPRDYPMVAPNYAVTRSSLAKTIGLGRKRAAEPLAPEVVETTEPEITMVPARRARRSKG